MENGNDTDVFRDYEMTYYRPTREEPEESAEPDNPLAYITIKDYIRWTDNRGNNEYKVKNVYHTQTYYPAWVDENQLTFTVSAWPTMPSTKANSIRESIREASTSYSILSDTAMWTTAPMWMITRPLT